ncbi:MAG: 50S ribosomal protein L23 [Chloroflexi bacterium]|nr:50S ribosomal protein L23 [Chloroflexota bacterium]
MQILEVLRRPLVTEKSTRLQEERKYAFEVARDCNKMQVKEAVERAFSVKVTGVNMITVKGHLRRVGRHRTLTPSWKKAVVTLREGDKIELFEGV